MAGTEGNEEMNVLKTLVTSLAQSVQTLTARQAAPSEQLKKSEKLTSELEYISTALLKKRTRVRLEEARDRQATEFAGRTTDEGEVYCCADRGHPYDHLG